MTGIKGKSGGKRDGAGQKKKYGEETVAVRVPLSLVPALLAKMKKMKETEGKKREKMEAAAKRDKKKKNGNKKKYN